MFFAVIYMYALKACENLLLHIDPKFDNKRIQRQAENIILLEERLIERSRQRVVCVSMCVEIILSISSRCEARIDDGSFLPGTSEHREECVRRHQ